MDDPINAELVSLLAKILIELDELEQQIRDALRDIKKPPEQPDPFFDEVPW